jgi:hypothetical protein
MSAPTMSQFATRLDCLEARDKYHVARVEELKCKNAELLTTLRQIRVEVILAYKQTPKIRKILHIAQEAIANYDSHPTTGTAEQKEGE